MKTKDLYQEVTDTILELMEKEGVFWEKPWFSLAPDPINITSKKCYRGVNYFLLKAFSNHYKGCNTWGTYKAFNEKGYQVNKGEKGHRVFFYKWILVEDRETGEEKEIPVLKRYVVFNLAQTNAPEEVKFPPIPEESIKGEFEQIESAEKLISLYEDKPEVFHDSPSAFYSLGGDFINMPKQELFKSSVDYYSTLFHELVHSTGAPHRLKRFKEGENIVYNKQNYSKEELVAELGASYLNAICGISSKKTEEQSAAYLKGWMKSLKDDKKFFIVASQNAQKAVDYIQTEKAS